MFEEAAWIATGVYFDADNNPIPAAGEKIITHPRNLWITSGSIKVFGSKPLEISTTYKIIPIADNSTITTMKGFNPALGNVTGMCVIIDDTIISTFSSERGNVTGIECLHRIDGDCYHNRGFTLKGNERISSWAFDLRRKT
jgi:hypothetical protein